MAVKKQRGLGRGLSALMADVRLDQQDQDAGEAFRADQSLPVEKLRPNPDQPRRSFAKNDLDDLAASIREKGIIQPLIVRPDPAKAGFYQIVAGERRWRAAQLAKLHDVPVLVRDLDDTEVLEIAIIENIQRAELNAVEEAQAFRQLMERFGHTQEKLAQALGKSRSHIANLMRLLQLPDEVLGYLRDGSLSAGHARALITSHDPVGLARQVIARGLSVREVERLAKSGNAKKTKKTSKALNKNNKDADTRALEGDLSASMGRKVEIAHNPKTGGGTIAISYGTLEELDALCGFLTSTSPDATR